MDTVRIYCGYVEDILCNTWRIFVQQEILSCELINIIKLLEIIQLTSSYCTHVSISYIMMLGNSFKPLRVQGDVGCRQEP